MTLICRRGWCSAHRKTCRENGVGRGRASREAMRGMHGYACAGGQNGNEHSRL